MEVPRSPTRYNSGLAALEHSSSILISGSIRIREIVSCHFASTERSTAMAHCVRDGRINAFVFTTPQNGFSIGGGVIWLNHRR